MSENEKVYYEDMVSLNDDKFDTLLTIREEHLLLKRKKGIFKRNYKIIKDILVNDIKVINDKVKIIQNKNKITIYTQSEVVSFTCQNKFATKKVIDRLNRVVLKESSLERFSKKITKVLKESKKTVKTVSEIIVTSIGIYKLFFDNPKKK